MYLSQNCDPSHMHNRITQEHRVVSHSTLQNTVGASTRVVEPALKFQAPPPAPAPGIYIFWFRLQHLDVFGSGSSCRTFWSKKSDKTLYCLYNSLSPKL